MISIGLFCDFLIGAKVLLNRLLQNNVHTLKKNDELELDIHIKMYFWHKLILKT